MSESQTELKRHLSALNQAVLNLSEEGANLQTIWQSVLDVRSLVCEENGISHEPESKEANPCVTWKSYLHQALVRKLKTPVGKDTLVYACVPNPTDEPAKIHAGWIATVTCPTFADSYQGEVQPNQKAAEQSAAFKAVEAEFPALFAELIAAGNTFESFSPASGQKRSREELANNPRSKLQHAMCLLLERPVSKADLEWTLKEEGTYVKQYLATLKLVNYDATTVHEGEWSISKHAAEQSAADVALSTLTEAVEQAEVRYQERKTERLEKSHQRLKAKHAKKEAAAAAAAAAAGGAGVSEAS
eukprot:gnl/TRDRNA2_/TRDRNA2_157564_c8_seq6.p1 gnl/TRDRNA2_/TRDRNA2_157564_c8~~gnl/TRDRNA2_/TRDRNA2_157564_c8_seq6.p1  ORF type:complete len:302 (+),score=52.82 gnl/TRDRNA2_/TRDRNA2_157564_c8_seq6:44-949(+)